MADEARVKTESGRLSGRGQLQVLLEQQHKEERLAWDLYAALSICSSTTVPTTFAAKQADALLAERRKRFPTPTE
jgi:hypothetical protein